jgi:hypothetical protein
VLRKLEDPVHDRLGRRIRRCLEAALLDEDHRGAERTEVLAKLQHLPPVAQGIAREELHVGERVEHHPLRLLARGHVDDRLRDVLQLDVSRREERVLGVRERLRGAAAREVQHVDAGEVPAVRARGRVELRLGLGKRAPHHLLSALRALDEELQGERGLAGAGAAFEEIELVSRQAAAQ